MHQSNCEIINIRYDLTFFDFVGTLYLRFHIPTVEHYTVFDYPLLSVKMILRKYILLAINTRI